MDNEDSAVHTKLTNISSNDRKLVLKRSSLVGFCLNSCKNLILTCVLVDNNGEEPSLTSLDLSSREDNWGWDIMSSHGELIFFLMLSLSEKALVVGFSEQVIRFSSHRRLIYQDTVGFNANSINRNVHSVLDFDEVTNLQVISVLDLFLSASSDSNLI